ncbi:MAG: hypothetical protein HYZ63_04210 [Candidatus Andersenbacteria bacterium]|nr:hypothetical protein [Candidatus Andersenbacteria bacterium]
MSAYVTFGVGQFSNAKQVFYGPFESEATAASFLKSHGWRQITSQDEGWSENTAYFRPYIKIVWGITNKGKGQEVAEMEHGTHLYINEYTNCDLKLKSPEELITDILYPEEPILKRQITDWEKSVTEKGKKKWLREAKREMGRVGVEQAEKKIRETEEIIRRLKYRLEHCPKPPILAPT